MLQSKDTDWLNGYKNIYILSRRLKVRGWKNIFYANGKQNKAGVAILISDKIDLKV